MIQPGTARLSCPHQYLKKESRGKGQEHHHFPPTLYWGWHREPHLLLPKRMAIPSKPSPLCLPPSLTQAVALPKGPAAQQCPHTMSQRDSVPGEGDLQQGMVHWPQHS